MVSSKSDMVSEKPKNDVSYYFLSLFNKTALLKSFLEKKTYVNKRLTAQQVAAKQQAKYMRN